MLFQKRQSTNYQFIYDYAPRRLKTAQIATHRPVTEGAAVCVTALGG